MQALAIHPRKQAASTIDEALLQTTERCDEQSTEATAVPLDSVHKLDRELAQKRREVERLLQQRDRDQRELEELKLEQRRIAARTRELQDSLEEKRRAIPELTAQVEELSQAQQRARERARNMLRELEVAASRQAPAMPGDRRRSERVPLSVEVSVSGETNFFVGFSRDISEGGLFVATYETRPIGTRMPLRFRLPDQPRPVRAIAEVAWVKEYREDRDAPGNPFVPGMGLKFVALDVDEHEAIYRYMHEREPLFFPEADDLD